MQHGQASFLMNKLCDIVFTRDELASSSGLGLKPTARSQGREPLELAKVEALYGLCYMYS